VYALIFLAAVLVTYGVLQINQLDPLWFSVNKLVYATIGNQGAYANVLGALAPFVLGLFFTTKKTHIKFFSVVLYFLINICLVYASSRAALLVNAVIFLFFLIYNIKINKYFSFAKSTAFVGLFALGLILFLKTTDAGMALKDKMQNNYVNKALTIRMLLIKNGISASQLSPVFGYGPETFSIAQRPFQSVEMNKYQSWEFGWIKAHNHLIQNLVSTGLLGLILSLILFVYTTYKSIKLFFDSSKNENHIYAMSFYLAYLFLFVVNLSSFNYLVTQVYSFLFPVMFFNCLNENKTVLVQVSKKIKVVIAVSVLVMGSVFIFKSYSYWLADVYYQKARAQFEVKNNNIEAEK
jgi:O-antigen ligase